MIDGTAVNAIAALAGKPVVIEAHGKKILLTPDGATWSSRDLGGAGPAPVALALTTLTGLVDYLTDNPDQLDKKAHLLHVVDPTRVELLTVFQTQLGSSPRPGELVSADQWAKVQRHMHAVATYQPPPIPWGKYIDSESFGISLQALFTADGDRNEVLRIAGTVKDEAVRQVDDDGVTQTVTARAGIVTAAAVKVPNPVSLAPFRTFPEIEQPMSKFILRMRGGNGAPPECALFEADGGAWKGVAMNRISQYLLELDLGVVVLA